MNFQSTSQILQPVEWNRELAIFEDRIVTQLLKRVYCDKGGKWEDPMTLESVLKYKEDKLFRWKLIQTVLSGNQLGKLNAKILHCVCILIGIEETAHIFARFIHFTPGANELRNFLSFALTVIPHLNQTHSPSGLNVMTLAVRHAVLDSKKIEEEFGDYLVNPEADLHDREGGEASRDPLENHLVQNLLVLIKWQEQSEPGSTLKHIGLNLADIRGELHEGLLNWALDYTTRAKKNTGGALDQTSSQVLNTFYSLMVAVIPQVHLPLSYQSNLLTKISAFIVSMLMFIRKEKLGTSLDGVDIFARSCAISGRIFCNQAGADPAQLLRALMDEVFGSYFKLFTPNGFPSIAVDYFMKLRSREVGARVAYDRFGQVDFLNVDRNAEHSIFKELRKMSMENKSAAAVAHSGTLIRKRPAKEDLDEQLGEEHTESAQIRRLLFVDFVEFLCLNAKPKQQTNQPLTPTELYNLRMCRFLGQLLVDRFAGDGLTSHLSWFSWEQERELIAQYIEVTKLLDKYPIVFDFLLLLSDVGFQGLCYVLPLVKALFVAALGQLENTSMKTEALSVPILQKCNQILALLISADYFPDILTIFHQLISNLTGHEVFVLMHDLWDFLRSTIPPFDEANGQNNKITFGQSELKKKEGSQLLSAMVIVIQRNITTLGHLLPPIIGICEQEDDDDWSIERTIKPIAVVAEIKR